MNLDESVTPKEVFLAISDRWGPFTLDAAASSANAKCPRYFTREQDGLRQSWAGERVWCNPPYSQKPAWVAKAEAEAQRGAYSVLLLPNTVTEAPWFHRLVWDRGWARTRDDVDVDFLPGRVRFLDPETGRPMMAPRQGSLLVIFHPCAPVALETPGVTLLDLAQVYGPSACWKQQDDKRAVALQCADSMPATPASHADGRV